MKNEIKRELNMLDYEISDVLEKLDVDLTTLRLRCKCFENFKEPHDFERFEKESELRLSIKEIIDEIKRLKEKVKNNKLLDDFLDDGNKISKLLTILKHEKHGILHDIVVLELKL